MAAICWCSTGLPADKWILVGGPLGYPAHIIWLPPQVCSRVYLAHGLYTNSCVLRSRANVVYDSDGLQ